jgi:hypothetical protein
MPVKAEAHAAIVAVLIATAKAQEPHRLRSSIRGPIERASVNHVDLWDALAYLSVDEPAGELGASLE